MKYLGGCFLLNIVFGAFFGAVKQKSRFSCKMVMNCPLFNFVNGKIITKNVKKMKKNSTFAIDFIRFLLLNGRKTLNC